MIRAIICIALAVFGASSPLLAVPAIKPEDWKDDFDYGNVVITLSLGRSGSTYLCDVTKNIVYSPQGVNMRFEVFNYDYTIRQAYLEPFGYLQLAQEYLRQQREAFPGEVIGFKWKPYHGFINLDDVWQWMKEKQFLFLHNYRNPLDHYISIVKHEQPDTTAHCLDEKCVQKQTALKFEIDVDAMLNWFANEKQLLQDLDKVMDSYGLSRLEVQYEDLAFGSEEVRIGVAQQLADYIMGEGNRAVTVDDLDTEILITSTPHQDEHVLNFDEVRKALIGTEYEQYLRSTDK